MHLGRASGAPRLAHPLRLARDLGVLEQHVLAAAVVLLEVVNQRHEGDDGVHAVDEGELALAQVLGLELAPVAKLGWGGGGVVASVSERQSSWWCELGGGAVGARPELRLASESAR